MTKGRKIQKKKLLNKVGSSTVRKSSSSSFRLNLTDSYISLFLGVIVVLIAVLLLFIFAKNKTYDKINSSASTYQPSLESENQNNVYEVKTGDSLWSIAEKTYGSGYSWAEIARLNNIQNPGVITAGTKLLMPETQAVAPDTAQPQVQNNGPSISGDSYKVIQGDYLWEIAIRKYGDGYKWPEIARLNNIPNPDLIYSGSTLKLP